MKTVANMDANYGRIRRFSVMAFTGNKQGLAGFALAKGADGRGALKRAKNRAGQKLVYIERHNEHTVLHDFYTRFGATQIFVFKKPEGFGLVCHRAIKAMCELIGIKDVYAKIKGSTNLQHIVKAFMLGLIRQKNHAQFANEKQLYLVEQREDLQNYPIIVGEPSHCRSDSEIKYDEPMNFSQIAFGDQIPYRKKPFEPFYKKLPSWENHLLKTEWRRNHKEVRRWHMREYGGLKDHLTSKFPEADATYAFQIWMKKRAEAAEKEED
ncbi:28S ribosomal protein S5, mitochondrial [Orchesella cincta]|uniref:28S ribosomal protein S5, mitochondrial n=1 Tax=Orchesella cincta TaxID=48709 RepID=A0A1D2N728_ORCCI|nr:28S ribosomal protein S5, mitochondrial [Orchesella cincta]